MAKKKATEAYRIGSKYLSAKEEYLLRGLIPTQMHTEYVQFPTWNIMVANVANFVAKLQSIRQNNNLKMIPVISTLCMHKKLNY